MKLLSVVLATLAATTVQAGAMAQWCELPGQGCYMIKRAAEASGEVKRSASAVADAVAEAFPDAALWCELPGQGCHKVKRAAEAAEEVKRSADAFAEAMAALEHLE
ncbi:mating alpha-pheromone PpgA [Aspergillus clavatus NRRL 1]|uniref:Mating alpha-pheromone PpgA n=1 Tax=Aspergillus clavatus (strain ATCC 1007 / CBS 513.65 / DSM 816 / NCTC 3887 / NRRL 1 / QM 1276 / 107) TaxID=344612 RepID=A1CE26_ASPCL|nr:mating alpha-pheromone PpgA [Aspergillus clavatus NRRL 1]EAW11125.1 mating alpha-pheromone PpgA [Aspergillus clavatus NRRL 1]